MKWLNYGGPGCDKLGHCFFVLHFTHKNTIMKKKRDLERAGGMEVEIIYIYMRSNIFIRFFTKEVAAKQGQGRSGQLRLT